MFLSSYVHKFDRKGRVSVPATFRNALAIHRQPNFVIAFPSFRLPTVECSGVDRISEMYERMETIELFSEAYENLSYLFAETVPMTVDPDGRLYLPEKLRIHANISDDVVFVGLGATFQMWEPAAYEEHHAAVRDRWRLQGTTLPPHNGRRG